MQTILWKTESYGGKPFHLARHSIPAGTHLGIHRHDFDEAFWVESGEGLHRTAQGEVELAPGDAVCIRADDAHGFRAGPRGLRLVNVSFPQAVGQRLATACTAAWPWRTGGPPRQRRLAPAAIGRLHGWVAELIQPGVGNADLDAFLLDLTRLMARDELPGVPHRFANGCAAFAAPRQLLGGTVTLALLCGCGAAHLNRLCRRWHGCTASEQVARLRLDWASRELRLTARPVADIAAASGMPHLGHFYRRFRGRFDATPKAWRDAAWNLFGTASDTRS